MVVQGEERRRERIRAAVDALPLDPREVYWLSAVEGLGYPEIAGGLRISVAQVEARLADAIVMLNELLGEDI